MLDQASIEKIEDSIAAAAEEKNTKKIKEAISSNPEILKCDIYCPPLRASHYTHLPPLYPIVLSDEHRERADELGEAGV